MGFEGESFPSRSNKPMTCRHAKTRLESGEDTLAVACIIEVLYDIRVAPIAFNFFSSESCMLPHHVTHLVPIRLHRHRLRLRAAVLLDHHAPRRWEEDSWSR